MLYTVYKNNILHSHMYNLLDVMSTIDGWWWMCCDTSLVCSYIHEIVMTLHHWFVRI
jgi:hypothetical protein